MIEIQSSLVRFLRKFGLVVLLCPQMLLAGDGLNFTERLTMEMAVQAGHTSQVTTVVASFRGSFRIPWLARIPLTNLFEVGLGSLSFVLQPESAQPGSIRRWTANRIGLNILRHSDDWSDTNATELGTATLTRLGNELSISGSFTERTTNGINHFITAHSVATDTSIAGREQGAAVEGVLADAFYLSDGDSESGFSFSRPVRYRGRVRDVTGTDGVVTTTVSLAGELKPRPTLRILQPQPNQHFTNEGFSYEMQATDADGVAALHFALTSLNPNNKAPEEDFTPYLEGSVESGNPFLEHSDRVSLEDYDLPGWHELRAWAEDAYGQTSAVRTVRFYLLVTNSITIEIEPPGAGTVLGLANGQLVEHGRRYTLEPRARQGYLFAGWAGGPLDGGDAPYPIIRPVVGGRNGFTSFTALFVTNTLVGLKGEYAGLILPQISDTSTNPAADTLAALSPANAGSIRITLGASGVFSGKLCMGGVDASFTGVLDPVTGLSRPAGRYSGWLVARQGQVERYVDLLLALPGNQDYPAGTLGGTVWFEGQTSSFIARRANGSVGNCDGRFTFVIPGVPTPTPEEAFEDDYTPRPAGHGAGTLTVDKRGSVRMAGTLGDGTPFSASSLMTLSNTVPFHASPYGRRGLALGWIDCDPTASTNAFHLTSHPLYWTRGPATRPTDPFYPQGIRELTRLEGRRYTPGKTLATVLQWPRADGYVRFENDGLADNPFTLGVVLFGSDLSGPGGDPDPSIRVDLATGLFNGHFHPGYPSRPIPFKGALLQFPVEAGGAIGAGWFLSPINNPSSAMTLRSE